MPDPTSWIGYVTTSPLPTTVPQLPPEFVPYIYSRDEVRRLIEATTTREHRNLSALTCRTLLLLLYATGLRISEALALRWSDVDWLEGKLKVERGIVCQQVDDVKTSESRRSLHIDADMLERLKLWKQSTQFSGPDDWMFASPAQLGRLPWSYDQVWRMYQKAGAKAGIGGLGTHSLRHTYRSWLDAVGTPIAVQQKLMRHADIRTTMNIYGDVVTDEMVHAASKVAGLALNGR